MIHSLHLSRQVILTGHLSREEMAACYALSCCYVCCAQTEELRLSAVEAAACGTPLLIRAGSGTATVVENKINGFLWSSETEALDLVRKFAKVQGPGREALMKMVSGTVRTLTPQNQARAAEVYLPVPVRLIDSCSVQKNGRSREPFPGAPFLLFANSCYSKGKSIRRSRK